MGPSPLTAPYLKIFQLTFLKFYLSRWAVALRKDAETYLLEAKNGCLTKIGSSQKNQFKWERILRIIDHMMLWFLATLVTSRTIEQSFVIILM